MGFAAAVAVPDGVAIASDSRLQAALREGPQTIMSDTQQKILPLTRFVAAVIPEPYHIGREGPINVRSALEAIRPDLPIDDHIDDVISQLPGRLQSAAGLDAEEAQSLDLRLIGYSRQDRTIKVVILEGLSNASERHSTSNPGVDWFGSVDIATRLVKGTTTLGTDDVDPGPPFEYVIPTPLMSLQDAIDLADTLVRTTATFAKFVRAVSPPNGEPVPLTIDVGGEIHSGVVRPSGFHWVTKPTWAEDPPGEYQDGLPHQWS